MKTRKKQGFQLNDFLFLYRVFEKAKLGTLKRGIKWEIFMLFFKKNADVSIVK